MSKVQYPKSKVWFEGNLLIAGAARSGRAAALLARRLLPDAEVVVCDQSGRPAPEEELAALAAAGVKLKLGNQDASLLDGCGLLVKSPGVPAEIPLIREARRRGVAVWGEIEFASRFLPNPVIGITGTNGKTTASELVGHILRGAGWRCRVAGNVGTALSSLAGVVDKDDIIVVELSSFQLEDIVDFRAHVAVLLNLSEDHLDRHADAAGYYAAKMRIFGGQEAGDVAVLNAGDPAVAAARISGQAGKVWFGVHDGEIAGGRQGLPALAVFASGGEIRADMDQLGAAARKVRARFAAASPAPASCAGGRKAAAAGEDSGGSFAKIISWPEASIKGEHNLENSLAAAAVCLSAGLSPAQVAAGLRSFPGVPHRLQRVAEVGGVTYVNDSKATNVAAAVKALTAFDNGVHLILGGSRKGCSFAGLAQAAATGKVKEVIAIGEAAAEIATSFKQVDKTVMVVDGLEDAVRAAAEDAVPGDVVLLAPACASFDQYGNFEQRGEHFISLVSQLKTEAG